MNGELDRLRGEIDRVDGELLRLFAERMRIAGQIGRCKRERGLPVLQPERERELLSRVRAQAGETLAPYAERLFRHILSASRAWQSTGPHLRCGLIGEHLGHSFSPAIHARLADYEYRLFELSPEELGPFLERRDFDGVNVTIPYKKAVLPWCAELTEAARHVGCVNTLLRRSDGTLLGHNTDYEGFCWLLRRTGTAVAGKKALVLGSGGASLTAQAALRDLGARELVVISRSGEENYVNLYERHADAELLVNATPVGMYPKTGERPVELERLPRLRAVLDVIYNPARTQLLLDAERLGIPCANGLGMLVAQAGAAAELFTGSAVPDGELERIRAEIERETKNLLLIGMPGCGKSTVGAALAERLGRPLIDLDRRIEERAGCPIPALFAREGEESFRRLEHELLCETARESGLVIACGGGIVTRPENRDIMRQNATVIWLRRSLDKLPTEGRPLSQSRGLRELYREREPLYRAAADLSVENDGSIEETLKQILEAM